VDRADFEHEIRNAGIGVTLEVKRIRQAMERLENHLQRMDKACAGCEAKKGWKRIILRWKP